MNLRLDVAYDGAPFHGFARQPDLPTVQGAIEDALAKLFQREIQSVGAGRTDAGVHALGQVMSLEAPDDIDPIKIRDSLNGMLGPAIAVAAATPVGLDFHARFSARSRTYIYAVLEGEVPDPFLARSTLYHPEPLDVGAMNEAAGHLAGPHDFSSFGRVAEGQSAERVLYELSIRRTGRLLRIRARANAFIQQMVRSLVGTLVQVGEGKRSPEEMAGVLAAVDRAAAGPVAAPHGLCLVSVEYDDGWSRPFDPKE
ncbi:MAG TPA: tRNA pseudouridine(38-40) synthase TruA [Actinomycetota bacterium]|nr:tRNA pseudouridine(38-40) synthase TruA [Actinomycetota bacterium]